MQERLFSLFLLFLGTAQALRAQSDSLQNLPNITLTASPFREFAVGTKHILLDSVPMKQAVGQSLAQTLMEQTGIYIKQYGVSGISSISFRGTGAGHTAVLWNGLPVNSFTLGEADFGNLFVSCASRTTVSAGAGSSLYGTGSIGGSIQMTSVLPDSVGQKFSARLFAGSFENFGGQLAYTLRRQKWALHQNIALQNAKNDFPFINTAKFERPLERQQNSESRFVGLQTDVYYLPTARNIISVHSWWQDRQNQFSPMMGANLQPQSYTQARQRNLKLLANWKHFLPVKEGEFELKLGYLQDGYIYDLQDTTATQTFCANAQFSLKLRHNVHVRAQYTNTFITAFVENFDDTKRENRQEIGAGVHWQPFSRLWLALNLRQMWVDGQNIPFTPSLGAEFKAGKAWRIKGYVGRTYRVPTLNDKYWAGAGNPFLRAENGITSEIGVQFSPKWGDWQLNAELTPYALWVQDWIIWTPTNNQWSPQNLRSVQARGIELQTSLAYQRRTWQIRQGLAYSYTRSTTEDKQLAYTPFHRLSAWLQVSLQNYFLYQNVSFTGDRYGSLTNTDIMPAFALWNMSVGKDFYFGKQKISLQFRLNNVLNTQYQNYENRAMPRRNYMFSLIFN